MLSPQVLGLIGKIVSFLNWTKAFLISWDTKRNCIAVSDSPNRLKFIFCITFHCFLYSLFMVYRFRQFCSTTTDSHDSVMDDFWAITFSVGYMSATDGYAQFTLRRKEISMLFRQMVFLDKNFNGKQLKLSAMVTCTIANFCQIPQICTFLGRSAILPEKKGLQRGS